jgi:hypothetical protein
VTGFVELAENVETERQGYQMSPVGLFRLSKELELAGPEAGRFPEGEEGPSYIAAEKLTFIAVIKASLLIGSSGILE